MVIDSSELPEDLYGQWVRLRYDLTCGVNFANQFDRKAQHLVATSYVPSALAAAA